MAIRKPQVTLAHNNGVLTIGIRFLRRGLDEPYMDNLIAQVYRGLTFLQKPGLLFRSDRADNEESYGYVLKHQYADPTTPDKAKAMLANLGLLDADYQTMH
jgi:hypothetical protein